MILVPLLNEQGPSLLTAIGEAGLKAVVALVVAVVAGRAVLRPVYRLIAASGSTELFVAATLLVVLSTGLVFSLAGLSMALGAFLAGLLLAETEYRHQVEADIRRSAGCFSACLHVGGMMVDIRVVIAEWLPVLGIVAGLLIGKSIVIGLLCRAFGLSAIVSGAGGPGPQPGRGVRLRHIRRGHGGRHPVARNGRHPVRRGDPHHGADAPDGPIWATGMPNG